jgi:predicted RND superfamily exporter protein
MTPEQELSDTIEEIRKSRFPELSPDLVKKLIQIERDFTENRQEAYKRITQAIDAHLTDDAASQQAKG